MSSFYRHTECSPNLYKALLVAFNFKTFTFLTDKII